MKKLFIMLGLLIGGLSTFAQELYVSTEPASNMPKNSIGFRLAQENSFQGNYQSRLVPEMMLGLSKNLMVHASAFASNLYQSNYQLEGWSMYAKYRFLSVDSIHSHFRGAVYGKYSSSKNPVLYQEINLDGNNSGIQGGVVFTQLLHKLALSGSVNYTRAFDNRGGNLIADNLPKESIGYTFSSGLLVYPKVYKSYNQPNINLYLEFLGKSNPGRNENLMEVAPAVQLILKSTFKLEISQRLQVWNNMTRNGKNMFLVRLEYNLFNVL